MLTQEDFVAPTMSAEGTLQRSSWKAEAIRRGDLKISGPFPITEELPLNEDEEREYAEKAQIDLQEPQSITTPPSTQPPPPPQLETEHESLHTAIVDAPAKSEAEEHMHGLRHKISSESLRERKETHRTSLPATALYTNPSSFPSVPRSSTIAESKKKRKGSLRNVFRKMFGRKAKESAEADSMPRHSHHRSEPVTFLETPKVTRDRITSARISELEPINPLGQHLPFPMNVNAPQELSPPHDYLTFDIPRSELNRRRATLPSVLQSAAEAQASEAQHADSVQSPQIGIALSSPPPTSELVQSKRRSRSAGALRDLAQTRPSVERRRSAEIRYWRNSQQSGSVYSTVTPRPQTARTVERVSTNMHDPAVIAVDATADSQTCDTQAAAGLERGVKHATSSVEAFNFGDLEPASVDNETEDKDSDRSEKRPSIDERIKHLEDNMHMLQSSVRRISGRSNRHTIILENAPKGRRSRIDNSSERIDWDGSRHSSTSSRRTLGEQQADSSATEAPLVTELVLPSGDQRHTAVALDASPLPASLGHPSDVAQQLAIISEVLKNERAARKMLELQVDRLQREVTELHAVVNKFISRSPSYPTPSPDTIIMSNEERLSTPRAASHANRGLGPDSEDDSPGTLRKIRETIISKFSQSDSEKENYSVTSSREDITSPEAWATSKEESGFGSGFFSENRSRDVF